MKKSKKNSKPDNPMVLTIFGSGGLTCRAKVTIEIYSSAPSSPEAFAALEFVADETMQLLRRTPYVEAPLCSQVVK